eukprot:scaffold74423_cov27-Tisochrysis_lutea.AAC.2
MSPAASSRMLTERELAAWGWSKSLISSLCISRYDMCKLHVSVTGAAASNEKTCSTARGMTPRSASSAGLPPLPIV